jgi:hypothetical protein
MEVVVVHEQDKPTNEEDFEEEKAMDGHVD